MTNLYNYLTEGGASGHMAHIHDYNEWTLRDIKGLIRNLFSGKIEDITEKVDGTNIQATMNTAGEVVFIRNNGDLNSARGGMTIEDMAAKWASKPGIAKTFLTAGETITKVFNEIGPDFFNPSENRRIVANCECVIEGKTNVMYYANSQVDFHDIWVYEKQEDKWVNVDVTKDGLQVIEKACEKVEQAQITPKVFIRVAEDSEKLLVNRIKQLDKLFKDAGCKENSTMADYKFNRFSDYVDEHYPELNDEEKGKYIMFNRIFQNDKKINIRLIKSLYDSDMIERIEKESTEIKGWCMQPMDDFFISLGNEIINMCDGIMNADNKEGVVKQLKSDLKDAIEIVHNKGNESLEAKMLHQLSRFNNDSINAVEGIVFRYKGKLTKLTGSFGPLNQILGYQYK